MNAVSCSRCGDQLAAPDLAIREVGVVLSGAALERDGLLAWVRLKVGPFLIAGLAVRRTETGDIVVTFPARKDRRGSLHRLITPLDPVLDGKMRAAVIAAYVAERAKHGRRVS